MGNFLSSVGKVLGTVGNAVLGGIPSAIGSIVGAIAGNSSQNKANQANMELAKYKYDKDLEMWNLQNEYNTPEAQMQRFAVAGLNPNSIYSQGNTGNASDVPSFSAPNIQAFTDYGDFGMARATQMPAQLSLLEEQKNLARSQSWYWESKASRELTQDLLDKLYFEGDVDDNGNFVYEQKNIPQTLSGVERLLKFNNLDITLRNNEKKNEILDQQLRNLQLNNNLTEEYGREKAVAEIKSLMSRNNVNESQAAIMWLKYNMDKETFDTLNSFGFTNDLAKLLLQALRIFITH